MRKLIDLLTDSLEYSSSWAVYAQKINGKFVPESPARFGQTLFENGGVLDEKEFFADNEQIIDRALDWDENYSDNDEDERIETMEEVISMINE